MIYNSTNINITNNPFSLQIIVYQLLAQGRWFSLGSPASSTTKTRRHDIAEILLKVALNTKNQSINPNHWMQIKKTTTYGMGHPVSGLGKIQEGGRVKLVYVLNCAMIHTYFPFWQYCIIIWCARNFIHMYPVYNLYLTCVHIKQMPIYYVLRPLSLSAGYAYRE